MWYDDYETIEDHHYLSDDFRYKLSSLREAVEKGDLIPCCGNKEVRVGQLLYDHVDNKLWIVSEVDQDISNRNGEVVSYAGMKMVALVGSLKLGLG
ncbi:MAG: hypothetical protein CL489_10755 [Acidobacteria bacterium]|nr:hypothetical protein [Acidobacteriota bacterium]|tara:strand:- start:1455 stop:1742 length:288 start_codon:yes stop_codon:yes gene_type:complete